ncbi:MAG: helix-hairpin-helix domain-containing protein, partial [Saprospiraceae bacterium]|nr:helix-hairpin-helix domain-containing protein [Saprospiraceae bacterium]
ALFDTDDFDSRIYAFENDIQYEFRIPFYQMKGTRMYLFARYKATRRMTLEARIDRTFLTDAEEIGSGGEEILGNKRNEIKAQMIYRW